MNKFLFLILIAMTLLCASCTIKPPQYSLKPESIRQLLDKSAQIDQSITKLSTENLQKLSNQLLPTLHVKTTSKKLEHHFDITIKDAPAKAFFLSLTKDTPFNMIVSPKIKGEINLKLKHVTIDQVLKATHDLYGYDYNKTSFGYEIYPKQLATRAYTINYPDMDRTGSSEETVSFGGISDTHKHGQNDLKTTSHNNFWPQLEETITSLLTNTDGKFTINPLTGSIVITAYPNTQKIIATYLNQVQKTINREVVIEAKIINVELDAAFSAGVDWNLIGLSQDVGTKSIPGAFVLSTSFSNNPDRFHTLIHLLDKQGTASVLSSPRVSTVNNQKAIIKVGEDETFITGLTSQVSGTANSGSSNVVSQSLDLAPFFSGIALDVTPQISADNNIILHIHPVVSKVTAQRLHYEIGGQSDAISTAKSDIEESDNIIRVKNGQMVALGGLMTNHAENSNDRVPGVSNIHGVGNLFKKQDSESSRSELIILLQPHVVGKDTWSKQLHQLSKQYQATSQEFSYQPHFGK